MWTHTTLGELCKMYQPKTISAKEMLADGDYVVFGANGIIGRYDKYNHEEPQLLVTCRGATCGAVNVSEPYSWINGNAMVIQPDSEKVSLKYMEYLFRGGINLTTAITGAAQPQITRKSLEPIQFSYPPLAEQQRIVAKLDAAFAEIDRAVEFCHQKIANAEAIYSNKLTQIFEEKGEDWICCSLKEITSKIGSGATPKGGKSAYKDDGLSLIRSMNVYDMDFSWRELAKIDDEQAKKLSNVEIALDDVLLNITGASIARCTVVPKEVLPARVNQHVAIIRTDKSRLLPTLLAYGLIARVNKKRLLGVGNNAGATRQAITKRDIEEFVFSFPQKLDAQRYLIDEIASIKHESSKLVEVYLQNKKNLIALKSASLAQELQPPQSEAA